MDSSFSPQDPLSAALVPSGIPEQSPASEQEPRCLNCGEENQGKVEVLSLLRAEIRQERLRLRTLIEDTFREEFHLNGKALLSLRLLALAPGKLTEAYLSGRRKSLLSPTKLFLWSGFLLLAVMIPVIGRLQVVTSGAEEFSRGFQEGAQMYQTGKEAKQQLPPIFQMDDSTEAMVLGSDQDPAASQPAWKSTIRKRLQDSIQLANDDPSAFLQHSIRRFPYVLITILPFFSLLLTLAYYRRGMRFLDHFIFLLNQHSLLFLVLAAAISLFHLGLPSGATGNVLKVSFLVLAIHNLLAFKQVYSHSWAGTILWGGFIGFVYLLTVPIIMLIISILVGLAA